MAKDHFVPRHYLRQFTVNGSEEIMVSKVSPYRFLGRKGLGAVGQATDFYEGEKVLNELISIIENDLAPVLNQVVKKESFTEPELNALRWLAVSLQVRTKKAAETQKVLWKRIGYEVIQSAIDHGKIPLPPEGQWTEEMVDFKGVPGMLMMNSIIPCRLEMQTLACKILKAPNGACFITSDNPALVLNQFGATADPLRNLAGFSKSGFQLLLPISPALCLFFYDAKVYRVGFRRHRLVAISSGEVDIVNALQIQSAEEFVYFHEPKLESEVRRLVARYVGLRVPMQNCLQTLAGPNKEDELLHFRQLSANLPSAWGFCRMQRHINFRVGDRRDPPWTALIDELMDDFEKDPNGGDMHARIEKILTDPKSLKNIRLR